jgi:hypothetical protein
VGVEESLQTLTIYVMFTAEYRKTHGVSSRFVRGSAVTDPRVVTNRRGG